MKRDLDGIYFRVKRNEKYENVCFSDLSETEREEICQDRPSDWYKSVAYHLADRLKIIGNTFDIVGEKGGE